MLLYSGVQQKGTKMDEIWVRIEEFPLYNVSDLGRIMKWTTGRIMKESLMVRNGVKISLVVDGNRYTRSVALLVAEAFVEGRTDIFNTPIHLDGNITNNRADNLMWRPRWFAWRYVRQFQISDVNYVRKPIFDVDTKLVYMDMLAAAMANGLLVIDIWRSIHSEDRTFPTGQMFDFVE